MPKLLLYSLCSSVENCVHFTWDSITFFSQYVTGLLLMKQFQLSCSIWRSCIHLVHQITFLIDAANSSTTHRLCNSRCCEPWASFIPENGGCGIWIVVHIESDLFAIWSLCNPGRKAPRGKPGSMLLHNRKGCVRIFGYGKRNPGVKCVQICFSFL
jgi:hypothetical protein